MRMSLGFQDKPPAQGHAGPRSRLGEGTWIKYLLILDSDTFSPLYWGEAWSVAVKLLDVDPWKVGRSVVRSQAWPR